MFFGREMYRFPQALSRMADITKVRSQANWIRWQFFIKTYIYLFGFPDVGLQLRALYFQNFLKRFNFNKVLDAGCGVGLFSFYMAKKNPSARIEACDYNSDYIKIGKAILNQLNLSNVTIFHQDLCCLSKSNEYDLIVCMDVIEHIKDDELVIANFQKALKEGGYLFLTTPHLDAQRRYFHKYFASLGSHVRLGYSEEGLTMLLQRYGFRVEKIKRVAGPIGSLMIDLYSLAVLHLPLPFVALLFPLLSSISLLDMAIRKRKGYSLVVIAQKMATKNV